MPDRRIREALQSFEAKSPKGSRPTCKVWLGQPETQDGTHIHFPGINRNSGTSIVAPSLCGPWLILIVRWRAEAQVTVAHPPGDGQPKVRHT